MKYTDRLGLKKPDQDDAYQVDDTLETFPLQPSKRLLQQFPS